MIKHSLYIQWQVECSFKVCFRCCNTAAFFFRAAQMCCMHLFLHVQGSIVCVGSLPKLLKVWYSSSCVCMFCYCIFYVLAWCFGSPLTLAHIALCYSGWIVFFPCRVPPSGKRWMEIHFAQPIQPEHVHRLNAQLQKLPLMYWILFNIDCAH